ncbi:MAG: M48 family metalloprotease [Bacilli bacterium]|nr:M48 family metalloprotease [Bacilli bacterium]
MKQKIFGISMLTITCLYGLLAGIVILAVMLLGGNILFAILGSLIVLIIQFLISPWLTDISMRWFYKANFNETIPDYLKKFIEEECEKHNIKYPKIGIIDDGAPNAFTYGRTKKDARLVLTRGIFELLNENEVKCVVGHEIGHIAHMDMLVMTAVQVVPLVLYAIYQALTNSKSNDKDDNKAAIVGYIAYILYIISQYFILWLSRTREYYADEFSVEETKDPSGLAEALVKIGFGLSTNSSNNKNDVSKRNALGIFDKSASKAMAISSIDEKGINKDKIKNAMKWEMWNPWAVWFELNSTHPLISKRLQAISKLSEKYNQKPYINFDLKKEESYVDDFLFELLISALPIISIITTVILAIIFNENLYRIIGIGLLVTTILSFLKFKRAHKSSFKENNVEGLLSEVKVSHITSIPAIIKGKIIGRGNPGCIFNEDFVIQDETGIVFLDYNQPLNIMNKIFALFKSEKYFDKDVIVKGWYKRSPVPYVEIYEYTVDGKSKKIWTYGLSLFLYALALIASVVLIIL